MATLVCPNQKERLWEMIIPRREGKTKGLREIAHKFNYDVYSISTSSRAYTNLGVPRFDLQNTPISCNTLLLIDDYNHCDEKWKDAQRKVLDGGGMVVRTKSNEKETCIKSIPFYSKHKFE